MSGRSKLMASPAMAFAIVIACAAMAMLMILPLSSTYKAGCGGPPSPTQCDYEDIFQAEPRALFTTDARAHFVLDDRGATIEVSPEFRPAIPGGRAYVLIDKKSCRVCEVSYTY